ncbi:hypothetical protein PW52_10355 [Tamlana sedimentorum]|uniref:OmpA-like domain-containing protein n=1 Tax=Neotamlana sedimentorum TaxID=1435349 RepID=A0A0D7W8L3_9FLAO|nr:hypothetical protein PW52_10355 [Tamlana sedimentorum]
MNKVVKVLKEHPTIKLAINALTDHKGRDSYNLKLSYKRAASTVNFLVKIVLIKTDYNQKVMDNLNHW